MVTLGSVLLILFAILALVSPIAFVICLARTRRWSADGLVCGGCGYPREGAVSPNCPECGFAWGKGRVAPTPAYLEGLTLVLFLLLLFVVFPGLIVLALRLWVPWGIV